MQDNPHHEILVSVDLGSNSFHMIIARLREGQFQVLDRLREMVQLRAGLDANGYLSDEAQARAIACLQRFAERIRDLPHSQVRVVGTNTLRVAQNSREFLRQAREALGHSIEIVTGEEEARLVYIGVARSLAFDARRRLVIDIGGGSTECIIGEGQRLILLRESLEMGCVSFSKRYFADGRITAERIQQALLAAAIAIRSIQRPTQRMGWDEVVGASGTVRAIGAMAKAYGLCEDGSITLAALDSLIDRMLKAGHVAQLQLEALSSERAPVIIGGACVLKAIFDRLQIERMLVSDGALREGVLYDMLGRIQHDDERERTVAAMAKRYGVDAAHAGRVAKMALELFEQVAPVWGLDDADSQRLAWASSLHEVGLAITHDQFHKHSAYLVANSDMPGFSREEQHALSLIVRGQRRSFAKKYLKILPEELQWSTLRLMVLLRLALVFNRGRSEKADTYVGLETKDRALLVVLPNGWLQDHPLTEADLQQEKLYLKPLGFKLKVKA